MKRMAVLLSLAGILGAVSGCAAPRIAGKTVSGVANGTVDVVSGVTKVVTSPLR